MHDQLNASSRDPAPNWREFREISELPDNCAFLPGEGFDSTDGTGADLVGFLLIEAIRQLPESDKSSLMQNSRINSFISKQQYFLDSNNSNYIGGLAEVIGEIFQTGAANKIFKILLEKYPNIMCFRGGSIGDQPDDTVRPDSEYFILGDIKTALRYAYSDYDGNSREFPVLYAIPFAEVITAWNSEIVRVGTSHFYDVVITKSYNRNEYGAWSKEHLKAYDLREISHGEALVAVTERATSFTPEELRELASNNN